MTVDRPPPPSEEATLPPPGAEAAPSDAAGPSAPPGYEILGELGRGSMGVVYRARQIKADRMVALKMILAGGHAGDAERARFRTEAEAAARLQHPHIAQVFEVGEHGGVPFFSLEFCPGVNLEKKLAGGPLPPREAAALVEQLARAMHYAHQKGIVHRDLKPANVLLAADGVPKVTDFGLARKLGEAGQTASGAVLGTPSYMAPEQAAGKGKEAGPAADVWALGAVLYECLTGRPPFQAATALDTILQVVGRAPTPPRHLRRGVPRALERICLKCLARKPGGRYASAGELADDLGRFRKGEPVRARPEGLLRRAGRWAGRFALRRPLETVSLLGLAFLLGWVGLRALSFPLFGVIDTRWRDPNGKVLFSPDGRRIVTGPGRINVWDATTGWGMQERGFDSEYPGDMALSPDGSRLALVEERRVALCDANTLAEIQVISTGEGVLWPLTAFSPDGARVAATGGEEAKFYVGVWDAASGRLLARAEAFGWQARERLRSLSFSPDGRRLAAVVGDEKGWHDVERRRAVLVWDASTGAEVLKLPGPGVNNTADALAFSPEGGRLAVCAADQPRVDVWDLATGKKACSWECGFGARRMAFSPDGRCLALGNDRILLWDCVAEKPLGELDPKAPVSSLAFRADGKRLAALNSSGEVRVWDVSWLPQGR
jgi:hypothetical protein